MQATQELLPDESLWQKTKSKWSRLYILSFMAIPISYALKALVSRELSVEDVGLMYAILWFVGFISIYNDLGLTDALQYFLPKYIIKRDFAKAKGLMYSTLCIQLASGLLLWWAMFLFADVLANTYFSSPDIVTLIQFFGVYFLCLNFFQALQSFYFSVQAVKVEKTIEFLRMLLVLVSVVVIRQFGFLSLFTLGMAWIIWLFISTIGSAWWFRKYYYTSFLSWTHRIEKHDVKKRFSYSIWSLLAANTWTIIAQVDMQLILLYMWKESAWYRSNYMSLNSAASFIFLPLLSFLFPVFTEYVEKWLVGRIRYMRKRIFILTAIYAVGLGIVCSMFGEEISMLLFGDVYQYSWQILAASAWLLVTPILGIINFQLLRSIWSVKQATILQWIVVCIHVLASYIVVQEYSSLIYMSYVFLGSYLLFFVLSQLYIARVWYEKNSSHDYIV